MQETLDIQRDHVRMIRLASRWSIRVASCFFTTNRKDFKLDPELAQRYSIEDITARTFLEGFTRRPKILQCREITQ